jgi:hypothetical protein
MTHLYAFIYQQNPSVVTIRGLKAFDADDNEVAYDLDAAQLAYNNKQYQRDRQPEYPSVADLADALYWSNQGDNTKLDAYYAACAAVKAKYPKPEAS